MVHKAVSLCGAGRADRSGIYDKEPKVIAQFWGADAGWKFGKPVADA